MKIHKAKLTPLIRSNKCLLRMRPLFGALLVVFCSNAYSEQLPKGAETPIKKEQVKGNSKNQSAKAIPKQTAESKPAAEGNIPAISSQVDSCYSKCGENKPDRDWWHEFRTDPVATFTGLLFFATLLLWWSTRNLVKGADKTAEKQLRAYISVDSFRILDMQKLWSKQDFEIHIVAKNYGQTPAYDVISLGGVEIGTAQNPVLAAPSGTPTKSTLGPNAPILKFLHKTALSDADIAGLNNRTLSLYAYGEIRYKDAFGKNRLTHYRSHIGGTAGWRSDGLMAHAAEGNDAD